MNSFSRRWVKYCVKENINYCLVDCYSSNILEDLEGVDFLLFNWWHDDIKSQLFMRQLTFALEKKGVNVFPNFDTSYHYDDKVGQKYLLESINAPFIKTYVSYDKKEALNWAENTIFPKVFKLRGGAGSMNVRLVRSKRQARRIINQAFTVGFSVNDRFSLFKDRILSFKRNASIYTLLGLFKGLVRLFVPTKQQRNLPRQKGYVYFQDFIPNNDSDMRIIVIGDKAFGLKRYVREGDFRASGSGRISYFEKDINLECVSIAFEVTKKLASQCVAFDFVFLDDKPLIVEISYAFSIDSYDDCEGYWNEDLTFHKGGFNPQCWMLENLIKNK